MNSIKVQNSSAPISDAERRNILLQRSNDPAWNRHVGFSQSQLNSKEMFGRIGKPTEFGSNSRPRNSERRLG